MRLLKSVVAILFVCAPCLLFSQQPAALHWYALKSIVPLDATTGKEALTIIREATDDSLSSFTDKSDMFKLATLGEADLDSLSDVLNEAGFFIIDITNPGLENSFHVRSSKGYQYTLLYCRNPDLFNQCEVSEIKVDPPVLAELSEPDRLTVITCGKFVLKE